MPSVKLSDLLDAFEYVSAGTQYEHNAYISRATGEIFWDSDALEGDRDLPDDLEESDEYIEVPHKNELDLGKQLVLGFVSSQLQDAYGEVEDIFRRKEAYSRYKSLLESRGKLEAWYQYEEEATNSALRVWSEGEGLEVLDNAR